jgi:RHH-type transcriptional regulator, rel operon repressor / antitoxin RelB
MSEVLSVRLSAETKKKLEKSAKAAKRSKSFVAAEAIEAYLAEEAWQLQQLRLAWEESEKEEGIPHEEVSKWLKTWGTKNRTRAPWQK